jgi:hypothetical protein
MQIVSVQHKKESAKDFSFDSRNRYDWREASLFYQSPSSPHAFYHRPIKVKGNISSFIAENQTFSKHYSRVMYTSNSINTSRRLQNGRVWTVHMSTSAIGLLSKVIMGVSRTRNEGFM